MELKEVKLESEKQLLIEFLLNNDLKYENSIEHSFYLIDDFNNIIGSISNEKNIIKCFAISKNYRGENIANTLISEMINYLYQNNVNHVLVYTKNIYENMFSSFGFTKIISSNRVSILEYGVTNITNEIKNIRKTIESKFDINLEDTKVNAVVINANPFTNGHMHLIEEALKTSNYLVVFLLEEDKSFYSFKERLSLAYISTIYLNNVIVIPSTQYIISNLTFPSYFLKEDDIRNYEWMYTDALIFKEYFMKLLNINYRYVGEETNNVMSLYNKTLKEVIGNKLIEIKRLDNISASIIRDLVKIGKIDEASTYIPHGASATFKLISNGKINE